MSVALLWKTKRRKTNNNSPPLTGWKDDDNILLLRNSRPNLSDGFDSVVEGALDSESSSRRIFQHHDQEEEHDLPSWSVCDEGSEAQFIWPPRQQVYQVLILAVLYAMHQSVVSHYTYWYDTTLSSHQLPGRFVNSVCWCKNHSYYQTPVDIFYRGANANRLW